MNPWVALVGVLAVCMPLLVIAVVLDYRSARRRRRALSSVPDREIPGFDGDNPAYVPVDDVLRRPIRLATLSSSESADLDREVGDSAVVNVGWASDRFATHRDPLRTILRKPLVIIVDEIGSQREVLTPIQRALQLGRPLAVAAGGFDPSTLEALVANRLHDQLGVLAIAADGAGREQLAEALGIAPLIRADLQAGYLPGTSIGAPDLLVCDAATTRLSLNPHVRVEANVAPEDTDPDPHGPLSG